MNGVLILDKPKGITSQAAVNAVNRILGARRAGLGYGVLTPQLRPGLRIPAIKEPARGGLPTGHP